MAAAMLFVDQLTLFQTQSSMCAAAKTERTSYSDSFLIQICIQSRLQVFSYLLVIINSASGKPIGGVS